VRSGELLLDGVLELLLTVGFLDGELFAAGVTKYELITRGLGDVEITSDDVDVDEVPMAETGEIDRSADVDGAGEVITSLKSESEMRVDVDIGGRLTANLAIDSAGIPSEFKVMTGATWEAFEVDGKSPSGLSVATAGVLSSWLETFVSILFGRSKVIDRV
jgi:hypothetical protein